MKLSDVSREVVNHWCRVCWGIDKNINASNCSYCRHFIDDRCHCCFYFNSDECNSCSPWKYNCTKCPLFMIGFNKVCESDLWRNAAYEVDLDTNGIKKQPDIYCLRMLEVLIWIHIAIINDIPLTINLGQKIRENVNNVLPAEEKQ